MTTMLFISGHGENEDGSFDPGALGFIVKGEHKYYEENMFPAMKKFLPEDHNIVFFSDYNVYDHKNLVALAKKYGDDTIVVEWHYDAGVSAASGGHVIVHKKYSPDTVDLKIRDVIKKHIGVRYSHKGENGISGRDNLGNCNRAANGGINYRLIELGFGTNSKDASIMLNDIDALAKDFVLALVGQVKKVPVVSKKETIAAKPVLEVTKSIEQLAKEVVQGTYGSGEDRKKALGSEFEAVQKRVNELLGSNVKVPAAKSIDQLVKEVLAGVHGNGEARKNSLGANYNAVMDKINGTTVKKPAAKSVDQLANEVIAGKLGSGEARKKALGSQYDAVQKRVNEILNAKKVVKVAAKTIDQLAKEVIDGKHGSGEARKKSLGANYNAVQKRVNQLL